MHVRSAAKSLKLGILENSEVIEAQMLLSCTSKPRISFGSHMACILEPVSRCGENEDSQKHKYSETGIRWGLSIFIVGVLGAGWLVSIGGFVGNNIRL